MSRPGDAASKGTKAMFRRLWAGRTHCPQGHDLATVGILTRHRMGYVTRECHECANEHKRRAYRREMADPVRAARRRERTRAATRAYRARRKEAAT